jgi:hypothetical protein
MTVASFDDYLKRFSFLPSGKWLREMESVKVLRIPFSCDAPMFSSVFKKNCIAYCCPSDPEEGFHRAIYQISPTLHLEAAFWIWIQNEESQSYVSIMCCFQQERELEKFMHKICEYKKVGNTDDRSGTSGFAGLLQDKKSI